MTDAVVLDLLVETDDEEVLIVEDTVGVCVVLLASELVDVLSSSESSSSSLCDEIVAAAVAGGMTVRTLALDVVLPLFEVVEESGVRPNTLFAALSRSLRRFCRGT